MFNSLFFLKSKQTKPTKTPQTNQPKKKNPTPHQNPTKPNKKQQQQQKNNPKPKKTPVFLQRCVTQLH